MANLFRSPSLNQTRLKPVKPKRVTPNESPLQGLGISGVLPGLGCCGLRQPGEVGLVRRLPVKARMRPSSIVEGQVSPDRGAGLADRVVGPEINLLVLD